jgi:uncharacterized protein (TIGR02246 family)
LPGQEEAGRHHHGGGGRQAAATRRWYLILCRTIHCRTNTEDLPMLKFFLAGALLAAITLPALADDVAATIIKMERTALERCDAKAFLEISAPDVVYLDPGLDKPLEGLAALTAYYAKFPLEEPSRGAMSDAKVQVFGDVAVLSFHYVSHVGSKKETMWNATEVYRKTGDTWRIVNTHWSLTNPLFQKLG